MTRSRSDWQQFDQWQQDADAIDAPQIGRFEKNARRYIRQIRNGGKQEYAKQYLAYLLNERAEPNGNDFSITVMAQQAVRMRLLDLIGAHCP